MQESRVQNEASQSKKRALLEVEERKERNGKRRDAGLST